MRHHTSSSNRRRFLGVWATGLAIGRAHSAEDDLAADVRKLCRDYIAGFGSAAAQLCHHHRLDGPGGFGALEKPEQIAKAMGNGQPKPFGYCSGIQDVPRSRRREGQPAVEADVTRQHGAMAPVHTLQQPVLHFTGPRRPGRN